MTFASDELTDYTKRLLNNYSAQTVKLFLQIHTAQMFTSSMFCRNLAEQFVSHIAIKNVIWTYTLIFNDP